VAEILDQKSDAAVSCPLDRERGLRVVFEEALGVDGPHLPLSQLVGFPVEGLDHLFCRREGPIDAALPYVFQCKGELPVHDAFGREGDLFAFDIRLEKVSHSQPGLPAHGGRQRNLILLLHSHQWHRDSLHLSIC